MKLSTEQSAKLKTANSSGQYAKSAYRAIVDRVLAGKADEGFLEKEFPLVKPAHVAHMLRQSLKDAEKARINVIGEKSSGGLGVCLRYVATA